MIGGKLRIDGEEYPLDDLTLDELEQIEDLIGSPLGEAKFTSAKTIKIIAFVILSGRRPGFTLEDAGRLKLSALAPEDDVPAAEDDPRPPETRPGKSESPGGADDQLDSPDES